MKNSEFNKLIAEFMGYVLNDNTGVTVYYNDKTCEVLDPDKLKFHSDWNWLMEVVEKIESLGFETSIYHLPKSLNTVKIFSGGADVVGVNGETKIQATYNACIEFIKWYNQQQKQP